MSNDAIWRAVKTGPGTYPLPSGDTIIVSQLDAPFTAPPWQLIDRTTSTRAWVLAIHATPRHGRALAYPPMVVIIIGGLGYPPNQRDHAEPIRGLTHWMPIPEPPWPPATNPAP